MAVCHFNHSSVKGRVLSDAQLKVHCSVAGGGQCPSAFCRIAAGYIRERWKGKVLIQHKKFPLGYFVLILFTGWVSEYGNEKTPLY